MHLPKLHQLALSSSSSLWSLQGIRIFGKTHLLGVWLCTFFRECLYVCIQALLTRVSQLVMMIVPSFHDHSSDSLQVFIQCITHNAGGLLHDVHRDS